MPNPFVHVELNTTDLDQAKAFYGWFSVIVDPTGASLALFKPKAM